MYKLIIMPVAQQDIKEAAVWYNSKQKGLGKRFTGHVRHKLNYILQNPYIAAIRYDDIHTAVLDVFPFMIHYSIEESEQVVVVYAVLHTSRNPDIWSTGYQPY